MLHSDGRGVYYNLYSDGRGVYDKLYSDIILYYIIKYTVMEGVYIITS